VVHSGADVGSLGTLKLDVEGLARRRDELETKVLASGVRARRTATTELPVRQVGEQLFKALFTGEVYGAYRASLGLTRRSRNQRGLPGASGFGSNLVSQGANQAVERLGGSSGELGHGAMTFLDEVAETERQR
jgi:hypothetical protein